MSASVWFDGWSAVWRTLAVGAVAYVAMVALLRIAGNRTLSKMNAFDFVVTVAMGSILATILLSRDVTLAQGVAAMLLLVALQFAITWLSVRSSRIRRLITAEPVLLVHRGEPLHDAMRRARVTHGEIDAAIRNSGHGSLTTVDAVVLETDGSLSVVGRTPDTASAPRDAVPSPH